MRIEQQGIERSGHVKAGKPRQESQVGFKDGGDMISSVLQTHHCLASDLHMGWDWREWNQARLPVQRLL